MEVPRQGVEWELQLLVYATAVWDPSSQQRWDQTCNLMVTSWICFCCAAMGTPEKYIFVYAAQPLVFCCSSLT